MTSRILILSLSLLLLGIPHPTTALPQDVASGVMLAIGQAQQLFEPEGGWKPPVSEEYFGEQYESGSIGDLPTGRRR
ncbi:uncharacterized protein [Drosophila takahashii]|uniref:uncharacterized protein n=1 Tax=Drosophila takahashii TaxID=29030 RepID=UPI001CF86CCE|nr:uncharacterized protein LOC108061005 [Drosophila takahashii]